jgi:ATP-dependent DNA helicase RecQ
VIARGAAQPALPSGLDLDAALHRLGYAAFRAGQREAIETLLASGRLLLVAPTGGGKSLIYQLPAVLLDGTTLVISPLISLMQDQVEALGARGVPATYLASTVDAGEMRRRMGMIARGAFRLVYLAPERLSFPGFRALVKDLRCPLVAVDEAHCISEWGHDFRPEYLEIGGLLADLSSARVLACTATATPVVRDEILARLGLPADTPQVVQGFARPNLSLRAAEVDGKRERARRVDAALAEALGGPGQGRGGSIVYAPTRRAAEEEGARLASVGWRARVYHAGLSPASREEAQRAFADGSAEVVVATNAFGMGIDRADVRAVIHLGPPGSIEAYYQEVGRAGRDGADALGLLLISSRDLPLRRALIERGAEGTAPDPAVVEHKWGLFLELVRWAEGGSCRHDAILRYFGDEAETLHGCGRCDVCRALGPEAFPHDAPTRDADAVSLFVRKALSGVARAHGRFGLQTVVALIHGDPDPRLERSGLSATPTFGNLREHPREWLTRLLRRCVTAGWVSFAGADRPVVILTEAGRAVMKGDRPARLLLPAAAAERAAAPGPRPARRPAATAEELDSSGEALFQVLRAWRLAEAREASIAPFMVASDRTLRDIARLRPRTPEELAMAYGIGRQKALRYGLAVLRVVAEASRT